MKNEEEKTEKPEKPEKPEKVEKVEKVVVSGKVAFIREGVTILRDVTESASLKSSGWVRK